MQVKVLIWALWPSFAKRLTSQTSPTYPSRDWALFPEACCHLSLKGRKPVQNFSGTATEQTAEECYLIITYAGVTSQALVFSLTKQEWHYCPSRVDKKDGKGMCETQQKPQKSKTWPLLVSITTSPVPPPTTAGRPTHPYHRPRSWGNRRRDKVRKALCNSCGLTARLSDKHRQCRWSFWPSLPNQLQVSWNTSAFQPGMRSW